MFGRRTEQPEPLARTVWADKTKIVLDDINKRRAECIRMLDSEEQTARALCNHTYPTGVSAIEHSYDDDGDPYTRCTVCSR